MKALNFIVATFPLTVVLAVPQLPVPTDTRAPCSTLGAVQCSTDKSHVQLCEESEIKQSLYWKDIEDCGEANGCHSRGPHNRAYCTIKYPPKSTHLGNIPTDIAVAVVESRREALIHDSTRCYEPGIRRCSTDRSTVQECTDELFWKDVQDCFQPKCCHDNKMFPSRPTCHCYGTLTTVVKGQVTPTVAPRAGPSDVSMDVECLPRQQACALNGKDLWICHNGKWSLKQHCAACKTDRNGHVDCIMRDASSPVPSAEDKHNIVGRAKSSVPVDDCINGQQRCGANGQDLYICVNHVWNLKHHCTECMENNGKVACRNNKLWAPPKAGSSKFTTRLETPASDLKCIIGQQKCGDDGKDMFICDDGDWKFLSQCDTCNEDNEIFTCLSRVTPLPSSHPTASIIWITRAAAGSETPTFTSPSSQYGRSPALIPPPELICTDGQLRCTSDRTSIEECQNRMWKVDRKCVTTYGGHCVSSRNAAHCGYTKKAMDVAPTRIQESKRDTPVFSPHPLPPCNGGNYGQLVCSLDFRWVLECQPVGWAGVHKCKNADCDWAHPQTHKPYCPPAFPPRSAIEHKRKDTSDFVGFRAKVPYCREGEHSCSPNRQHLLVCRRKSWVREKACQRTCIYEPATYRGHCAEDSLAPAARSTDIVPREESSDECANGERYCSIDRKFVIVCVNGHWKNLQYCGPAGCDYKRPSYEPYCPYPPTLSASLADKTGLDPARSTDIVALTGDLNKCGTGGEDCSMDGVHSVRPTVSSS